MISNSSFLTDIKDNKMNGGNKMRIFITGDTHCPHDIHKLNSKNFKVGNTLTKDDIVIICGDAGFVWSGDKSDQWWIKWITQKPWTTVYVDGNHENHPLLNSYPEVDFHGAKAHQITDSLYHIKRGEIMTLNNERYFCFGGAFSHDVEYRIEGKSWWQEELPTQNEVDNAMRNLNKVNNQVDYIITHDVATSTHIQLGFLALPDMERYDKKYIHLNKVLQNIMDTVEFKVWFAGHYHVNKRIDKVQILYDDIVEIKKQKKIVFGQETDEEEYYQRLEGIQEIMSRKFTKDELLERVKKEKLYVNSRKMDTIENFSYNEYAVKVEDFIQSDITNMELDALNYLYNQYTITKDTLND